MTFLHANDLLSPLGSSRGRPDHPLAPRLDGLAGKTLGLLDNSKQNAGVLLDAVGEILRREGAGEIVRFRKPSAAMSAGAQIETIAARCDAVVNAFGDCGSCTSWCVHDSCDLEREGIPVATINTIEFASLGRFEAAALGMPLLPIVVIPHPIGSLGEEAVRAIAAVAATDIVTLLTRDADDMRAEYRRAVEGHVPTGLQFEGSDCGCAV